MKRLVIVLAVIILVLLGILIFVSPAKGPTILTMTGPAVSADGGLRVYSPQEGIVVGSPVTATGTVTGGKWFFEASFPVRVLDGDGTILGTGLAEAQSDWMTTGTVPFIATITFTAPRYATGTLLFEKDNPSGLPEYAGELRLPIRFK